MQTFRSYSRYWSLAIVLTIVISISIAQPVTRAYNAEPASPPAGNSLEARIEQRKNEQDIILDAKLTKRLQEQCKNAQPRISRLVDKTDKLLSSRIATYQHIDGTLLITLGKLKLAEKDTFALEQLRTDYLTKVGVFKTNMLEYRQALDDAVVMNCQADTEGFKALVDTARIYNDRVNYLSLEISTHMIDRIKPAIDAFAVELEPTIDNTEG